MEARGRSHEQMKKKGEKIMDKKRAEGVLRRVLGGGAGGRARYVARFNGMQEIRALDGETGVLYCRQGVECSSCLVRGRWEPLEGAWEREGSANRLETQRNDGNGQRVEDERGLREGDARNDAALESVTHPDVLAVSSPVDGTAGD